MNSDNRREEQFLQLFLRNEDDLKSYARALLPCWEAVDDVIQNASVVIWRKMDELREQEEFMPWAKVIVRFECLKARRTVAKDRHCFSTEVLELLADHDSGHDEEELFREREARKVCLGALESAQRELVLTLYREHGMVANLAAQSNRTVNSLYKKIRRLRQKLTQCVSHKMSDPSFCRGQL